MLADPRTHTLRDRVRAWLGTDTLTRMETTMAEDFLVLLRNIAENTSSLDATQQAVALNIKNGFTNLEQKVTDLARQLAEQDRVTDEMKTLAAEIGDHMTTIKKNVEAMDNGYEPVEEPADGAPTGEVPTVEPAPAAPAAPDAETGAPTDGTARQR